MVDGAMPFQVRTEFIPNRRTPRMKTAHKGQLRLEIVEDNPEVGFYLYVYEGDRCIADHLQNNEETCKQIAFEEYGVESSCWIEGSSE